MTGTLAYSHPLWAIVIAPRLFRDQRAVDKLAAMGWWVLCVWECATRRQFDADGSRCERAKISHAHIFQSADMTSTVQSIVLEFSQSLRSYLTPEQMVEVVQRNRAETHPNICHSHDFCDANMFLHEVFMRHGMDPADEDGMERWGVLWDQSWNLAKGNEFAVD